MNSVNQVGLLEWESVIWSVSSGPYAARPALLTLCKAQRSRLGFSNVVAGMQGRRGVQLRNVFAGLRDNLQDGGFAQTGSPLFTRSAKA